MKYLILILKKFWDFTINKNNTNHIVNKDNEENIAEKVYFYDGKKASQK